MSNLKKIIISLPASLLEQTDLIVEEQKKNRSELIREALNLYLAEQKKKRIRAELIRGYEEMSGLNLRLAEEGMREALTDLDEYETKLL
jgi:CopG family transcriptional regulator/antitoxin EndoAI